MSWVVKHKSGRILFVTDSKVTADNREKMGWIVEEMKMTSREQFEAWCINRGISITKSPGHDVYQNPRTKVIWEGWQASRAAIEIKLPNQACLATWHYAGSPPDDFYEDIEISRNPSKDKSVDGTGPFPLLTKWEVEQAIESAGLKVKK